MNLDLISMCTRFDYGQGKTGGSCWGNWFSSTPMNLLRKATIEAIENNKELPVYTGKFTAFLWLQEGSDHSGNYCLLTEEELTQWLQALQQIYQFKSFSIECVNKKTGEYAVHFDLHIGYMQIKLLCYMFRHCYEYVGSIAVKEVANMKKAGLFKRTGWVQLFLVVMNHFAIYASGHPAMRRFKYTDSDWFNSRSQPIPQERINRLKLVCMYPTEVLAKRFADYKFDNRIDCGIPSITWPTESEGWVAPMEFETTQELVDSIERGEVSKDRVKRYTSLIPFIIKNRPDPVTYNQTDHYNGVGYTGR